jgi:hypothetical protein
MPGLAGRLVAVASFPAGEVGGKPSAGRDIA